MDGCKEALARFYDRLHAMPCIVCGTRSGIEADHIKPYSLKARIFTRRSHKGLAAFFAVPLCKYHHAQKTKSNEDEWYEKNVPGGKAAAYAAAMRIALESILECET